METTKKTAEEPQVKATEGENAIRASVSISKEPAHVEPPKEQGNQQPSKERATVKPKDDPRGRSRSRDHKHHHHDKEKEKKKHQHPHPHHHHHHHKSHHHDSSKHRSHSRRKHQSRRHHEKEDESSSSSPSGSDDSSSSSEDEGSKNKESKPIAPVEEKKSNFSAAPEPGNQRPTTILQSKHERQLYVGNLPPGLNGPQVTDLLNRALIKMNAVAQPGEPIVNSWVSSEGRFAFVEFRSPEDVQKAFVLSNVSIMGYPIKVGKSRMNREASGAGGPNGGSDRGPNGGPQGQHMGGGPGQPQRVVGTKVGNILLPYIPRPQGPAAPPKTVGEMTAQIIGYKTLEKLQVGNLPLHYAKEDIERLMSIFGKVARVDLIADPKLKKFNGQCFIEYTNDLDLQRAATGAMGLHVADSILETKKVPVSQTSETVALSALMQSKTSELASNPEKASQLIGISPSLKNVLESHPSRVVKLKNLVNVAELFDNTYYEDLMEDIQEESQQHGQLVAIEVPRPTITGGQVPGMGAVFIEYQTVEQAMSARQMLNGKKFSGKVVEAVFYPEDSFKKKIFDL